jgi:predicted AlkP superfamily pyrophosphatase or phosphodiesterase
MKVPIPEDLMRTLSALLGLMLCAVPLAAQPAPAPAPRHALIVSIDGLMPSSVLRADELGLQIPTLRRLVRDGAWARGVVGVLPTVTYPSHTTLITGVPPRLHGIGSNTVFDPEGRAGNAWNWYARDIRVPTLVSAARVRGLTTGAVAWPVSVGLAADWNLPEFWRPGTSHPVDLKLLDAVSTPGLIAAVEAWRGKPFPYPVTEAERADTALYLLATHRPGLLLVHLIDLDFAEHSNGPGSPEAHAALERCDAILGRLLAALDSAGRTASTLVAVVSDHGFLPVAQTLQPNTLLREAGLLAVDDKGKIKSWRAVFHASGGSAALHLADMADMADPAGREVVEIVRRLLAPKLADPAAGIAELLGPERIAALGGAEDAALVLDARAGFYIANGATGDWLAATTSSKGTHGHAPDRPELHASFFVTAPGLTRKGDLGIVPMTAIGPTVARWLGLTLAPEAGAPLDLW